MPDPLDGAKYIGPTTPDPLEGATRVSLSPEDYPIPGTMSPSVGSALTTKLKNQFVPKTKTEAAVEAATLPLFLYGGPEAPEGAALGARALYGLGRAATTGAETVASDIIGGLANKFQGKPSGLSLKDEAKRFAFGAAAQPALEAANALVAHGTGLSAAEKAAQAASDVRSRAAADAVLQHQKAATALTGENRAVKALRSVLGGTASEVEPGTVNQATRESQNALSHTINSIHNSINEGYRRLFAPYAKNEVPAATIGEPLMALRDQLHAQGRDAQLGTAARKLLNDSIELGNPDPLLAHFSPEKLAKMSPKEREGIRGYFETGKSSAIPPGEGAPSPYLGRAEKAAAKPIPGPKIDQVLTQQSRANAILRSRTASATDKAVAAQVNRSLQGALDEAGDGMFLTEREKLIHQQLKGQTRSFYSDFGDLMGAKAKTPADIGKTLFEQPPHVIARTIASAKPEELDALRRSFADYALPTSGADLNKTVAKLSQMDRDGTLRKLYPGRYGRLTDWTSTFAAQKQIEQSMQDPVVQQEAADGVRDAMKTPEGRAFQDRMAKLGLKTPEEVVAKLQTPQEAALAALKPKSQTGNWLLRWFGMYGPIELAIGGFGVWRGNPAMAGAAFATFATSQLFNRALANDAFRARYLAAITNKSVRNSVFMLARLGMGMALRDAPQDSANSRPSGETSSTL